MKKLNKVERKQGWWLFGIGIVMSIVCYLFISRLLAMIFDIVTIWIILNLVLDRFARFGGGRINVG